MPITYADNRTFDVKVLGLLGQRRLVGLVKKIQATDDSEERFDCVIAIVKSLAAGDVTDEWLDTITMADANEIMTKGIQLGQVSEDERKKFE